MFSFATAAAVFSALLSGFACASRMNSLEIKLVPAPPPPPQLTMPTAPPLPNQRDDSEEDARLIKRACFVLPWSRQDPCSRVIEMMVECEDDSSKQLLLNTAASKQKYGTADPAKEGMYGAGTTADDLRRLEQSGSVKESDLLRDFLADAWKKVHSPDITPRKLCEYFADQKPVVGANHFHTACREIVNETDQAVGDVATVKQFILNPFEEFNFTDPIIQQAYEEAFGNQMPTGLAKVNHFKAFFEAVIQCRTKQGPLYRIVNNWLQDQIVQFRRDYLPNVAPENTVLLDHLQSESLDERYADNLIGLIRDGPGRALPDPLSAQIFDLIVRKGKSKEDLMQETITVADKAVRVSDFINDERVFLRGVVEAAFASTGSPLFTPDVVVAVFNYHDLFEYLQKEHALISGSSLAAASDPPKGDIQPLPIYQDQGVLIKNEYDAIKKACNMAAPFFSTDCAMAGKASMLPLAKATGIIAEAVSHQMGNRLFQLALQLELTSRETDWRRVAIGQLFLIHHLDQSIDMADLLEDMVARLDTVAVRLPTRTEYIKRNLQAISLMLRSRDPLRGGETMPDAKSICQFLMFENFTLPQQLFTDNHPPTRTQIENLAPYDDDRDLLHGLLTACRVQSGKDAAPTNLGSSNRAHEAHATFSKLLTISDPKRIQELYGNLHESRNPLLMAVAEKVFKNQQLDFTRVKCFGELVDAIVQIKLRHGVYYGRFKAFQQLNDPATLNKPVERVVGDDEGHPDARNQEIDKIVQPTKTRPLSPQQASIFLLEEAKKKKKKKKNNNNNNKTKDGGASSNQKSYNFEKPIKSVKFADGPDGTLKEPEDTTPKKVTSQGFKGAPKKPKTISPRKATLQVNQMAKKNLKMTSRANQPNQKNKT